MSQETQNDYKMEFAIIQAICRTAMCNENDAIKHQISRLKDFYLKEGKEKEAKALDNILEKPNLEVSPFKIVKSSNETLNTQFNFANQINI